MTTNRTERPWVPPSEAARHLGVPTPTIYQGIKNGTIPHFFCGLFIRIPKTWLDTAKKGN